MTDYRLAVFRRITPQQANANPEAIEWAREQAETRARLLFEKWKTQCPDWNIEVRAYPLVTSERAIHPFYCQTATQEFFRNNPDPWRPHKIHIIGDQDTSGGGMAYGNNSVTYESGTPQMDWHETGHTQFLGHSSRLTNGRISEYGGDGFMGLQDKKGTVLEYQALMPEKMEIEQITEGSKQVILRTLELDPRFATEGSKNAVRIDDSANGMIYYLSCHQQAGPYAYDDWKTVHVQAEKTLSNGGKQKLTLGYLSPGQAIELGPRWTVRSDGIFDLCLIVEIVDINSPEVAQVDILFTPLRVKSGAPLTKQDEGLYYTNWINGQGFDLHFHESRNEVTLYYYTFNDGETSRRWYMLQGAVTSTGAQGTIYEVDGATYENPFGGTLRSVGYWDIANQEEMHIALFFYGTGPYSVRMDKLASPVGGNLQGLWYDPEYEKSGFSIQQIEQDRIIGYLYTYGNPKPFNPIVGPPDQPTNIRWYMLDGTPEYGKIYEVQGGELLNPKPVEVVEIGDYSFAQTANGLECEVEYWEEDGTLRNRYYNLTKLG